MPGFGLERFWPAGPLSRWSHSVEDRARTGTPYPELVARVRTGPPAWSPVRLPAVDRLLHRSGARHPPPGPPPPAPRPGPPPPAPRRPDPPRGRRARPAGRGPPHAAARRQGPAVQHGKGLRPPGPAAAAAPPGRRSRRRAPRRRGVRDAAHPDRRAAGAAALALGTAIGRPRAGVLME